MEFFELTPTQKSILKNRTPGTVLLELDVKLNQMSWPHNNVVSSMHNIKEVGGGMVDLLLSPQNTTRYPIQWKKDLVTVFYVEGSTT